MCFFSPPRIQTGRLKPGFLDHAFYNLLNHRGCFEIVCSPSLIDHLLFLCFGQLEKKEKTYDDIGHVWPAEAQRVKRQYVTGRKREEHGVLGTEGRVLVTVSLDNQWQPMESILALSPANPGSINARWPCASAWTDRRGVSKSLRVRVFVCCMCVCVGREMMWQRVRSEGNNGMCLPAFATSITPTIQFANGHAEINQKNC